MEGGMGLPEGEATAVADVYAVLALVISPWELVLPKQC